jgi:toxin ParE1/3/4
LRTLSAALAADMPEDEHDVVWSPEAEQDLLAIWIHVAREASPDVADEQLRSLDRACEALARWPYSGRARDELFRGVRSIAVEAHVVFYRVGNSAIEIIRVLHGRRDVDAILSRSAES